MSKKAILSNVEKRMLTTLYKFSQKEREQLNSLNKKNNNFTICLILLGAEKDNDLILTGLQPEIQELMYNIARIILQRV